MSYVKLKDVTQTPHRIKLGDTVLVTYTGIPPLSAGTLVKLTSTHATVKIRGKRVLTVPITHLNAPTQPSSFDIGDHVVLTTRSASVLPSVNSKGVVLSCDTTSACVTFTMTHDTEGRKLHTPITITQNQIPLHHLTLDRGYDVAGDMYVNEDDLEEQEPQHAIDTNDNMVVLQHLLSANHLHIVLLRYNLSQLHKFARWLRKQHGLEPQSNSLTYINELIQRFESRT